MSRKAHRKLVLIFGTVGSGKSVLVDNIIKKFQDSPQDLPIIVLDSQLEYEKFGTLYTKFADFARSYIPGKKEVYILRFEEDDQIERLFQFVKIVGSCLLIVEEAEEYLDVKGNWEEFYWLIKRGRHRNISLVCVSQRVTDFPTSLRAQYTSIFTFRQLLPADIKRLGELGFNEKDLNRLKQFKWGDDIHKFYLSVGEPYSDLEKNL